MKFNIKHKVRFDRGRMYYSYINSFLTALLVWVFTNTSFSTSVIVTVVSFLLIYGLGYADEKLNILKREQRQYSEENPILMEILKHVKK